MPIRLSNPNRLVADVPAGVRFSSTVCGLEPDASRSAPPGFAILRAGDLTPTLQSAETPGAALGSVASLESGVEAEEVDVGPTQVMGWGSAFDARDPTGSA